MSDPIAIIGGGPAGLMAAECLAQAGLPVQVYEAMPSVGRKLLMAGRGGLNLTHSESLNPFLDRYGAARPLMQRALTAFSPDDLRAWAAGLGIETFVGTSGRVFPQQLKASPLLRAWLRRLEGLGVAIHLRHRWTGFAAEGGLRIRDADGGEGIIRPLAALLALGGASWPRLGSDGAWQQLLTSVGVDLKPLQPANAGIAIAWSPVFADRAAGKPLKNVILDAGGARARGELVITRYGIEGGVVYALGSVLRDARLASLDLKPDLGLAEVARRLATRRPVESRANHLRKALRLGDPVPSLLREVCPEALDDPQALARAIKALPLRLAGMRGLDRAISSAGGVALAALDDDLMMKARPGLFAAGEMLDWEAPTGGYLLQGCLSTGVLAAQGMIRRLGGASLTASPGKEPPS